MIDLPVFNSSGEETGRRFELSSDIFGLEDNDNLVYLDVKRCLASQRYSIQEFKGRSFVKGSTKKIKKQKGTGTARAGSRKSPLFVGGGVAFGSAGQRSYSLKLNKKAMRKARFSALSAKVRSGDVMIVEDFDFETPSTKKMSEVLNYLKLRDTSLLFVPSSDHSLAGSNICLSSRNVYRLDLMDVYSMNTYRILKSSKILFFEGAVKALHEKYAEVGSEVN